MGVRILRKREGKDRRQGSREAEKKLDNAIRMRGRMSFRATNVVGSVQNDGGRVADPPLHLCSNYLARLTFSGRDWPPCFHVPLISSFVLS
jgi:hypothetical protein